jgi:hypothetical protein
MKVFTEHKDDYIRMVSEVSTHKAYSAYRFMQEALLAILEIPKDRIGSALEAAKHITMNNWEDSLPFLQRVPIMIKNLEPDKTYTRDEFLLEYIHDLKTAGIVSQLIDMKKYGKEYAQKCGRFY